MVETGGGRHRDHRLGFELRVPGAGWKHAERPTIQLPGTVVTYEREDAIACLIGAHPFFGGLAASSNGQGEEIQKKLAESI